MIRFAMRFPSFRINRPTFEQLRARMIAETSAFITECLEHPELAVRIPIIPADSERFPPSLTHAFWDGILFDACTSRPRLPGIG